MVAIWNSFELAPAAEALGMIPWEADPRTLRYASVGDGAGPLLGYPVARWTEPGFWSDRAHREDRDEARARRATCGAGPYWLEYRMIATDGRPVLVHERGALVSSRGAPRLRGVLIDITPRLARRAAAIVRPLLAAGRAGSLAGLQMGEDEVVRAWEGLLPRASEAGALAGALPGSRREELEALLKEHEERQRARDLLFQMIVHDIKGALVGLLGNAELILLEEGLSRDARDCAEAIVEVSRRTDDLVLDILDAVRGDGSLPVCRAPTDLTALLRSVVTSMRDRCGGVVVQSTPGGTTAAVDARLFRRVLGNLLDNAVKYGGGSVTASIQPDGAETVTISVTDDGPGIPANEQDCIFDPYVRLGSGSARRSYGLGLAFCKRAVEAHGGRIWVESDGRSGASFRVQVPVRKEAA